MYNIAGQSSALISVIEDGLREWFPLSADDSIVATQQIVDHPGAAKEVLSGASSVYCTCLSGEIDVEESMMECISAWFICN